jgi:hypothetical protein
MVEEVADSVDAQLLELLSAPSIDKARVDNRTRPGYKSRCWVLRFDVVRLAHLFGYLLC